MRRFTDFLVVSFLISEAAGAMTTQPVDGSKLFEVKGNERTRTSYIVQLAESCLEDRNDFQFDPEVQLKALNQCLMNAKIFAKVSSNFVGAKIRIEVEEKWTLIPAPFFQSSGSSRKYGLILFETNFLGQGLTLALGANTGNKGTSFFTFFTNPSILGSRYFTNVSFSKDETTYEQIERRETVSDAFQERSLGGNFSFGYRFAFVKLSANLGRTQKEYDPHESFVTPSDYSLNRAGLTLDYDDRDYKLYFSDGLYSRVRYSKTFQESDQVESIRQWEGTASYQFTAFEDHSLYLMASALDIEGGRKTDAERVGSNKGFRGIETRTAWAKDYFVQSAEYQVPLKVFEKGTLTNAVFYDHGQIENAGGAKTKVDYHAAGLGLYFFLSRIAIPGFGLEWGTNSNYQKTFVNFSIGMSY